MRDKRGNGRILVTGLVVEAAAGAGADYYWLPRLVNRRGPLSVGKAAKLLISSGLEPGISTLTKLCTWSAVLQADENHPFWYPVKPLGVASRGITIPIKQPTQAGTTGLLSAVASRVNFFS